MIVNRKCAGQGGCPAFDSVTEAASKTLRPAKDRKPKFLRRSLAADGKKNPFYTENIIIYSRWKWGKTTTNNRLVPDTMFSQKEGLARTPCHNEPHGVINFSWQPLRLTFDSLCNRCGKLF